MTSDAVAENVYKNLFKVVLGYNEIFVKYTIKLPSVGDLNNLYLFSFKNSSTFCLYKYSI